MPFALEDTAPGPVVDAGPCPHHTRAGVCRASFSAMPTDHRRQRRYCGGEDHDLCPLFLARELRTSRFHYGGASRQELLQK